MNLKRYLERIEWKGEFRPDLDTLRKLHLHHATKIPFENLDIQLGKKISLHLEDLQKKMVEDRRGGYCFEQNTLFQAALQAVGFDVIACEARVRMGRSIVTPRTHMMLIVTVNGSRFLADVGFGGDGLLFPVPMDGEPHVQFLWKYRLVAEEESLLLQTRRQQSWIDLYSFLPSRREMVDFQVANWFTSTHPDSKFVQTLTVQLPTPEARHIVRNKTYVMDRGNSQESHEITSKEELLHLLTTTFGLHFPVDTSFHNPRFEK